MATITRRWYVYNGATGGHFNHANYLFISSFPNYCPNSAPDICAILGVYEISGSPNPSDDRIFGTNPQPFNEDTALFSYISAAFNHTDYLPNGTGQKPYIYRRYF